MSWDWYTTYLTPTRLDALFPLPLILCPKQLPVQCRPVVILSSIAMTLGIFVLRPGAMIQIGFLLPVRTHTFFRLSLRLTRFGERTKIKYQHVKQH